MGRAWSAHEHPKADEWKTQMVPSSETQVSKAWDLSSNQALVCFGGMLGCSASICPESVGPYIVWQGRICLEFAWTEKEVQIAVSSEPVVWAGGASAWAVLGCHFLRPGCGSWLWSRRKRAGKAGWLQGLWITQAFTKSLFQSVLGVSRLQLGIFLSLPSVSKFCLFKVTLRIRVIYT